MSKIEKLKSYKALLYEGVITQDEFETIKKAILSDNSKVNQAEPTEKIYLIILSKHRTN